MYKRCPVAQEGGLPPGSDNQRYKRRCPGATAGQVTTGIAETIPALSRDDHRRSFATALATPATEFDAYLWCDGTDDRYRDRRRRRDAGAPTKRPAVCWRFPRTIALPTGACHGYARANDPGPPSLRPRRRQQTWSVAVSPPIDRSAAGSPTSPPAGRCRDGFLKNGRGLAGPDLVAHESRR